jgi:hypothetical protein
MTTQSALVTRSIARWQRGVQSANKTNYPLFFGLSFTACYHFATEHRFHDLSSSIIAAVD